MTHVSRTVGVVLAVSVLAVGAGTGVMFLRKERKPAEPLAYSPIVRVYPAREPVTDKRAMQPGAPLQPRSSAVVSRDEQGAAPSVPFSGRAGRRSGMRASGIPSVSKIPDRAMARGTEAISIPFFIMDDDTSFESIRVSVQTQNADLFPMGNISHTCNMGACSLTLMPAKNQMGRGRLVLVVQDGLNEVKAGFVVRVLDPDLPFVGPVGDMVGKVNQVIGPIAFMVDDMQTDPELLSLEVMSSNLSMVPVENIVVEGQGSERAVTITPLRDAYGMTEVTIAVSDGEGQTVLRSFRVDIPMPAGQKTSLPVSVRDAVPLGMPDPYSHLPEDHPVRQRMKR